MNRDPILVGDTGYLQLDVIRYVEVRTYGIVDNVYSARLQLRLMYFMVEMDVTSRKSS